MDRRAVLGTAGLALLPGCFGFFEDDSGDDSADRAAEFTEENRTEPEVQQRPRPEEPIYEAPVDGETLVEGHEAYLDDLHECRIELSVSEDRYDLGRERWESSEVALEGLLWPPHDAVSIDETTEDGYERSYRDAAGNVFFRSEVDQTVTYPDAGNCARASIDTYRPWHGFPDRAGLIDDLILTHREVVDETFREPGERTRHRYWIHRYGTRSIDAAQTGFFRRHFDMTREYVDYFNVDLGVLDEGLVTELVLEVRYDADAIRADYDSGSFTHFQAEMSFEPTVDPRLRDDYEPRPPDEVDARFADAAGPTPPQWLDEAVEVHDEEGQACG